MLINDEHPAYVCRAPTRSQVAIKAMMVAHELMREPDQRVLKYVAMRPRIFNLSGFRDRCNVDGTDDPPPPVRDTRTLG